MSTPELEQAGWSSLRSRGFHRATEVPHLRMQWTVPGLVPLGELTVLAGAPGVGKSLLTLSWAGELARAGHASVLVNGEDALESTTKPRIRALNLTHEQAERLVLCEYLRSGLVGIERASEPTSAGNWDLWEAVTVARPRLLVIDPFTSMVDGDYSVYSDQHMRSVLLPLKRLAREASCSVVYVLHLNKSDARDPFGKVGGAGAFTAFARSGIAFGLHPDDPEETPRRFLTHFKCNAGPKHEPLEYRLEPIHLTKATDQTGVLPEDETVRLVKVGAARGNLDLFAARTTAESRSELERAREYLLACLSYEEAGMPVRELLEGAHAHTIAPRTLERAKAELGVVAYRDGKAWNWRLPEASEPSPNRVEIQDRQEGRQEGRQPPLFGGLGGLDLAQPCGIEPDTPPRTGLGGLDTREDTHVAPKGQHETEAEWIAGARYLDVLRRYGKLPESP